MAAELIAPQDELSGLPLPLLIHERLPDDDPRYANMHHAHHPSTAPELQSLGGKALRNSRVQLVRASEHNIGDKSKGKLTYHDFYKASQLTDDEDEQYIRCLFACAGYIPERAIDLSSGEPELVTMSHAQRELMRLPAAPREVKRAELRRLARKATEAYWSLPNPTVNRAEYLRQTIDGFRERLVVQATFGFHHVSYSYQPMRDFFRAYVVKQDLQEHLQTIDEFLGTSNPEVRFNKGQWLLAKALEKAGEPMNEQYREAYRAGLLHPKMPSKPHVLTRYKLGQAQERVAVVAELEQSLRLRFELAA
ncbi:MAG: hypothetical protein JWN38_151 [Candidatus Saccharibacteria bacterium]|nr:hypothetical protein [Candidatus Saccharibacteria bacterium]